MNLLPTYTKEQLIEYFTESQICSVVLINSDLIICSAYKNDDIVILFNPVIVDGYVNEDNVYEYMFRKMNVTTNDSYVFVKEKTILYFNTLGDAFSIDYAKYLKYKEEQLRASLEEKPAKEDNVVSIKTVH